EVGEAVVLCIEILHCRRQPGVAGRPELEVEIDALDRAVADVARQEDRRRRGAEVIPELAELLVLVLPQEGFEVELQRVAQEAVLAADRVRLDAFGPISLNAAREREAAGVIAGLETGVDHVPRR